jgi:hypothetical protein
MGPERPLNRIYALIAIIVLLTTLIPVENAEAGGPDEMALGFVYGTAFGLVFSGAIMIVYRNPDADLNIETAMIIGGMTGAVGGLVLGYYLPENAVENDPVISMKPNGDSFVAKLKMPTLVPAAIPAPRGIKTGLAADLFRFEF